MKHLQDAVDNGRDHIELTFNKDREPGNYSHNENRSFIGGNVKDVRPRSNYVQMITILLILGLFGGLVIIMGVVSATFNKVTNLKIPSTVTTAYESLGLPGYEGYSWDDVVSQANGETVNMMIAADNTTVHYKWITLYLAPKLLADYNINVKLVNAQPCPITGAAGVCSTATIVSAIKTNVASSSDMSSGAYDIVWINGANFYNMKTNNLLYGPFANKIPSSANFNFEQDTLAYDFKVPTSGYEMPYGFAYNIFMYSVSASAQAALLTSSTVNTVLKIATWIKTTNNVPGPGTGKFTYASPAKLSNNVVVEDNFGGAAFLKQAFYEVATAGSDASFCTTYFATTSATIAACRAALVYNYNSFTEIDFSTSIPSQYTAVAPYLFKFLRDLEPDLYQDTVNYFGRTTKNYQTYQTPSTASLTNKFKADSVWVMNTYDATAPASMTNSTGNYVAKGYVLSTGILANSNFFAIPVNAKNKLAAMAVINYVSSPAAMYQRKSGQLSFAWSQYQAYDSTADDFTSEGDNWNIAFDSVPTQKNCVDRSTLVSAKIPEPSVAYVTQLETDWYYCVFTYGTINPNPSAARCG